MQALKLWRANGTRPITGIKGYTKAVVALEASPMLLGVGYIIGPRIASVMVGGGMLASLLLVPLDRLFRRRRRRADLAAGTKLIGAMTAERDLRTSTSSTSARGPWPRAASSACSRPCR